MRTAGSSDVPLLAFNLSPTLLKFVQKVTRRYFKVWSESTNTMATSYHGSPHNSQMYVGRCRDSQPIAIKKKVSRSSMVQWLVYKIYAWETQRLVFLTEHLHRDSPACSMQRITFSMWHNMFLFEGRALWQYQTRSECWPLLSTTLSQGTTCFRHFTERCKKPIKQVVDKVPFVRQTSSLAPWILISVEDILVEHLQSFHEIAHLK